MSGQWEVVGKKKERSSKLPVPKANNNNVDHKRKQAVKIEEVLPRNQLLNLYGSVMASNEVPVKKPQEKGKNETKKPAGKKVDKPQQEAKPKPPKSIESALNAINVSDFKSLYETIRNQSGDAQLILRELAQYLSQKIPITDIQDPVFSNKAVGYPFSIVPPGLKVLIEKAVKEAGAENNTVFFNACLTTMASDMCKNLPTLGHKIFLQCIALNEPSLFAMGITSNLITLLNSYQNRVNIGLSILWAVGHVGVNNKNAGLRVFKEFMLPLIEMKNYSRFVVKYLINLVKSFDEDTALSKDEYLLILDTVYGSEGRKNFPSDLKKDFVNIATNTNLQSYLFKSKSENYKMAFNALFKKLHPSNNSYHGSICDVIVQVFSKDSSVISAWDALYRSNLQSSTALLNYLSSTNTDVLLNNKRAFQELFSGFQDCNEKLLLKKKKDEGLIGAIAALKKVQEKMLTRRQSKFPLKTLIFLLVLMVATTVYFDVQQHGSWKESTINKILKDYGVCETLHKGYDKVKEGVLYVDGRIEESTGYHKIVGEFSEPYVRLFKNLGVIFCNVGGNIRDAVVEQYPSVLAAIQFYAPGVVEQSQKAVNNAWSVSTLYFNRSVDYLKTEVFVGQLSPENVQRVVIEAFNTTQQKATEYYHWLYEKVQTTIK